MNNSVRSFQDLRVYQAAMDEAMSILNITKTFPPEEKYSLTDQMRRSSRSVCANIAEAWRKRRYKAAFIAKLSDAETEVCETQVWIDFAGKCGYLDSKHREELFNTYEKIIGQLVKMIDEPNVWLIKHK